jgi:5-methylcytosine-specific restriction protein A
VSILDQIKPKSKSRIYDMVRDAGVDVSDWMESKGNALSAAANPKYCYNWSFVQPNKVVVLNLWHSDLKEKDGIVTDEWNARAFAKKGKGVTAYRAKEMDEAIRESYQKNLLIRVVLCDGAKRNRDDLNSKASKVHYRSLDSEPWHVEKYDMSTGQATLMRGFPFSSCRFIDQFDMPILSDGAVERVETKTFGFKRSQYVRYHVLQRANGKCEYCGKDGFYMDSGQIYLETHHVIPLSDKGPDAIGNVAALCPNHHREAHHGKDRAEIRRSLQKKLDLAQKKG